MSYYPKQQFVRHPKDKLMHVFKDHDQAQEPLPGGGKRWWSVTISRVLLDGKGDVKDKHKSKERVFGLESDALAMAFARSPCPFTGEGEVRTKSWIDLD